MASVITFIYGDDIETVTITTDSGIPKHNGETFPDWGRSISELEEEAQDQYHACLENGDSEETAKRHAWMFFSPLELVLSDSFIALRILDYITIKMLDNPGWHVNVTIENEDILKYGDKRAKLPTVGSEMFIINKALNKLFK